jgi:hypothetical protein
MYVQRLLRPGHDSWNTEARGPHERRMIARSTQLTGAVAGTKETADSVVSNPRSRKRRGHFSVPMTRRSGVTFIAPWGMMWRSAKLFYIGRRCHPQQRQCHRNLGKVIIVGKILTEMSRWRRLMLSLGAACSSPPRRRGRSSSAISACPAY